MRRVACDIIETIGTNLIGNIRVEDLYKKSYPRNNLLFGLMQRMDLVEKIGSGLVRINEMMEEYLLPHPVIDVSDVYFGISFERPDLQKMSVEQRMKEYKKVGEKVGERVGEKVGEKVTENQNRIISLISGDEKISIVEIARQIDMAEKNVENNLRKLKEKGLLNRVGPDKGGYWKILSK